jgi:hypothetical protein
MELKILRVIPLIAFLLAGNIILFGQAVGESEVTSISLKKPVTVETEMDDPGSRDVPDTAPPRIRIISPQVDTGSVTYIPTPDIYLIGRLTDDSGIESLFINDSAVSTDDNGFFQQYTVLNEGLNVFQIEAIDLLSNASTRFLQVIYDPLHEVARDGREIDQEGEYHALVIGINEYSDPDLVDLDNPVTDATLLYSTLIGNYMFDPENVTLMKDPSRADIISKLDELSYRLNRNDNLLIFYAGHGYWDEQKETGYWLPADADKISSVNWIRNSTIQDFIEDIDTKHTLLITDACFAGSIFKSRGAFQDASIAVNKLYSLRSRKAMTSGTLKEVPDRSVFLEYLSGRLNENEKKYISAGELFSSMREAVLNNSPNIPQYGVIQDSGDEGGDFIFIKR